MLNSGEKKLSLARQKKKKFELPCYPKKNSERNKKNINPLQVKWSVPNITPN